MLIGVVVAVVAADVDEDDVVPQAGNDSIAVVDTCLGNS